MIHSNHPLLKSLPLFSLSLFIGLSVYTLNTKASEYESTETMTIVSPSEVDKISVSLNPSFNSPSLAPWAIVYTGSGTCDLCYKDAVKTALNAGFNVYKVNEGFTDFSIFEKSKLWVQPGGVSVTAAEAMGSDRLDRIRKFVSEGGGYVGFCAGAFLSTKEIGTSGKPGLGIMPGRTKVYDVLPNHKAFKSTIWDGKPRTLYFSGGPELLFDDSEKPEVEIFLTFNDKRLAGAKSHFGKGRVAVTGPHPEAGNLWKLGSGKSDADGNDQFLAGNLMKWATQK